MIFVTGATGFIGRELIQALTRRVPKREILCLIYEKCNNELERSGRKIVSDLGVECLPVDLLSGSGLKRVPKRPDRVYHLASCTLTSHPDHSINDVGTKNLLEAIGPLAPGSHFVYTSSIAVSDNRRCYERPADESLDISEDPASEYGRKKLKTERYLIDRAREEKFSLSIVRVCGVYGRGARKRGLFDMIELLVRRGSWLARLNWPGKISIAHVKDVAHFILSAGYYPPAPGSHEIYIPSMEALNLSEMSRIIHASHDKAYNPIMVYDTFWKIFGFLAKKKHRIEKFLPHRAYDMFWKFCIMVNNEFWNDSLKKGGFMKDCLSMTFREYDRNIQKEVFIRPR